MAARKQLWHPDEVRKKIQASQLINRLMAHINSSTPLMDSSQVTAAIKLLGKVIPDLSSTTIAGDPDNPLEVINRVERVIVSAAQDAADRDTGEVPTTH